jgi:hypothetical protein
MWGIAGAIEIAETPPNSGVSVFTFPFFSCVSFADAQQLLAGGSAPAPWVTLL